MSDVVQTYCGFIKIGYNVFAVGDVALSLEYVRAPYCLLRVMRVF